MRIRGKQADADAPEILNAGYFRDHLTGHQTLQERGIQSSLRMLRRKRVIRGAEKQTRVNTVTPARA
jgi:hypothetical protein